MPPLFTTGPFNLSVNTATMASSSRSHLSYAVTIELMSNTTLDRRVITLEPDQIVQIGRASRSEIKNLQPADDNALFDCPVVSRQHAEIRLSSWQPKSEQISITDLSSLHGTTVNGRKIEAGTKFTLKSGDVIKLGDRVTRGDDTHDGVSVTYTRLEDTASPHHYTHSSPTGNSYGVPSEDSDFESDIESVHSFDQGESSAHTTPENNKLELGSQGQPIFIGDSLGAPVIDLSQEDQDRNMDTMHFPKRSAQLRVIPDTYEDEEEDADQGALIPSEDERSAYESDEDHGFDDSLGDEGDEENEDDQDIPPVDYMSGEGLSEGEASHLDDRSFDADLTSAASLNNGPSRLLANIRDRIAELRPANQAAANDTAQQVQPANDSFTGQKPRYDPVRNSQPPVENEPLAAAPATAPAPVKTSTYTYGPFGYGTTFANPATNLSNSSRWDKRPANVPSLPQENVYEPGYTFNPANPFASFGTPLVPMGEPINEAMPAALASGWHPLLHQPPLGQSDPAQLELAPVQPDVPATVHDSSAAAGALSKISIPSIIDEPDVLPQEAQPQEPSSTNNKRKASEMEVDTEAVAEFSEPSVKQQKSESTTSPRSKRRRTQRRGPVREVASGFARYGGAALFGAAATVAFLSSPAAQWLIETLN